MSTEQSKTGCWRGARQQRGRTGALTNLAEAISHVDEDGLDITAQAVVILEVGLQDDGGLCGGGVALSTQRRPATPAAQTNWSGESKSMAARPTDRQDANERTFAHLTYLGGGGGGVEGVLEERVNLGLREAGAVVKHIVVVDRGQVLGENGLRGGALHVEADTNHHRVRRRAAVLQSRKVVVKAATSTRRPQQARAGRAHTRRPDGEQSSLDSTKQGERVGSCATGPAAAHDAARGEDVQHTDGHPHG
jgi:hypothetical protein